MNFRKFLTGFMLFLLFPAFGQVILPDFIANSPADNVNGVGRTAVSVGNGDFAIGWQDFNDYTVPVTEIPRVGVQRFSAAGNRIGLINLFRGESRNLSIWTGDYLTSQIDMDFLPGGTLLVGVSHEGWLAVGSDDVWSAEVGFGAVSATGEIIDISNQNGVVYWLIPLDWDDAYNIRLAVTPTGEFIAVMNGPTWATGRDAVGIQEFDANGNEVGSFFVPHSNDPSPNAYHRVPDIATSGTLHLVVWQDSRQDNNFDITGQFYTSNGPLGGNFRINAGDPGGTLNIYPSVAMNAAGNSVVVWADNRNNSAGEIWGQRYNASGQAVGANFQVSAAQGEIWDRPEVAMRNDGSFMVVWTDSMSGISGVEALRARARQYNAAGNPTSSPQILPSLDIGSGLADVASDGSLYYCSWLDTRTNNTANVYGKVLGDLVSAIEPLGNSVPGDFHLAQNYPNPFNPETTIEFALPHSGSAQLRIYNSSGQLVRELVNQPLAAGQYALHWDGTNDRGEAVSSGVYLYQLRSGSFQEARKMMLVR
ncbi:MAG: T9SS type A sorting domain-containing protein [Calditrichaeota bacterium]|nr:T9SS type A sorting domain-containing protein [Calditrichota bacterium]